ncbi:MAG: hypothetical protein AAF208_00045 [Cyanobacteria bacterium P01_A01_bin.45]
MVEKILVAISFTITLNLFLNTDFSPENYYNQNNSPQTAIAINKSR